MALAAVEKVLQELKLEINLPEESRPSSLRQASQFKASSRFLSHRLIYERRRLSRMRNLLRKAENISIRTGDKILAKRLSNISQKANHVIDAVATFVKKYPHLKVKQDHPSDRASTALLQNYFASETALGDHSTTALLHDFFPSETVQDSEDDKKKPASEMKNFPKVKQDHPRDPASTVLFQNYSASEPALGDHSTTALHHDFFPSETVQDSEDDKKKPASEMIHFPRDHRENLHSWFSFSSEYDYKYELESISYKVTELCNRVSDLKTEPIILDEDSEEEDGEDTKEGSILKWRREYSDVNSIEKYVVGVEEDIKKIVGVLTTGEKDDGRVICIHGMGGVGKTTLAKQIYHHSQVRSHFQAFAWAPVSDDLWRSDFSEKRKYALVSKILMQLTETNDEEIDGREGAEATDYMWAKLGALERRKCLVVLDDVWMDLKSITTLMLFNKPGIKVLLTTRNKPSVPPGLDVLSHKLRCLDTKQSWELFEAKANFRRALIGSDECYSEMKEIAEKMLDYCAGLPLAINVLAQLLSEKHTAYEWEEIFHNNSKTQNVIFKDVLHILSLSCNMLPLETRYCFYYLAHFPKDFKIEMKEVCRMYAAESISQKLGYQAKPYESFKLLVERSLVQVQNLDFRGEIKTLHIHNLMRDVCYSGASHLVKLVNYSQHVEEYFYCSRRMAFHLKKDVDGELLPWKNGTTIVKSLMCFTRLQNPSYEDVIQPILDRFRCLRVLKFENLTQGYIGNLPEEIGELKELRFLSLKGSHVEEVPPSIGNLVNLETLDLRTKWTTKLPNVMWKLENLRFLYLAHRSHISGDELMRLGNLRFLEILVNIPLVYCDLNELSGLCRVTKLTTYFSAKWWKQIDRSTVRFLVLVQSLAVENSSRSKKIDLMSLDRSQWIEKLRVEGKIVKLPEHDHFPMLIKLTLIRTYLKDDPMTTLERLSNLRVVVLGYNSFTGSKMVCSSCNFSKLESLSVVALENLEEWTIEQGALPTLGYLLIEYCHGLEALPDGLRHVASLKKLVVKAMPEEFRTKLDETGKDFDMVRHVAEIEFRDCESVSGQFMSDINNSRSGSKRAREDGD